MILVYVSQINERIQYTFSFIFEQILGIPIQFTDSTHFFQKQKISKISYSIQPISDEPHFSSAHLLFEEDIQEQDVSELLKDPFAFSFFLLARYEEYLPFKKDRHGRFSYQASILKDRIDVTKPWIDDFAYQIYEQLKHTFPTLEKKDRDFQFINTIDIDHAWLYKNKSWKKNTSSLLKKALKLNGKGIINQISILLNFKQDPYYIYPYIQSLQIPSIYFISFGKGTRWDTNHNHKNKNYQKLINELKKIL